MPQENVERYRQGIDAFNRRDLDAFLPLVDPWVIWVSRVLAVEGGAYEGHDGVREWWNGPLDEKVWHVSEWRDGRVVQWQIYATEPEALEAVGLSE